MPDSSSIEPVPDEFLERLASALEPGLELIPECRELIAETWDLLRELEERKEAPRKQTRSR